LPAKELQYILVWATIRASELLQHGDQIEIISKKLEIPLGVGVSGVPRFIRMTALFFIIGIFP